jgi:iron complex transport system ATP-binding protein
VSAPPVIDIAGLTVDLAGRRVLDRVSMRLAGVGLVALVGPNGAGKSTCLRAMAGLVGARDGDVRIDGRAIRDMAAKERARRLAYLPQERTVHWPLRVRDIVGLGRLGHGGGTTAQDRLAVARALEVMDVTHLADRPVLAVSGGERARVLLARALAQEPHVLLADEPAAGLDPAHQWALHERFAAAAADGMRVVVATHDLGLVARFAADVVLLSGGRLIAHGPPADVLTPARLAEVFGMDVEVRRDAGVLVLSPRGLARPAS